MGINVQEPFPVGVTFVTVRCAQEGIWLRHVPYNYKFYIKFLVACCYRNIEQLNHSQPTVPLSVYSLTHSLADNHDQLLIIFQDILVSISCVSNLFVYFLGIFALKMKFKVCFIICMKGLMKLYLIFSACIFEIDNKENPRGKNVSVVAITIQPSLLAYPTQYKYS